MITSAQARSMAEASWGRGGTSASRTNRKGAFYFSCSGHGGFVIDARCLDERERALFRRYLGSETATEIVRADGSVRRLRGPLSQRSLKYYPGQGETHREAEIFFAEEDCDWAVAVVVADIKVAGMTREEAVATFLRWKEVSSHDRVALGLAKDVADPAE